jgi:hypothetical protein
MDDIGDSHASDDRALSVVDDLVFDVGAHRGVPPPFEASKMERTGEENLPYAQNTWS